MHDRATIAGGSTVRTRLHPAAALSLVALLVAGAFALVGLAGPAGAATTKTVEILDTGFGPPALDVDVGDTVVWTNSGTTTHDVSADDGSFQSGPLSPGQSFPFTFSTPGTFVYRSTTDADLTGSVSVGGAGVGTTESLANSVPTDPTQPTSTPTEFAYTGTAESVALALVGSAVLLFGYAALTGAGPGSGRREPWRVLALADPRRSAFTDELMPRRWRRTPRRSRQADLLPATASERTRPHARTGSRRRTRR